MRGLMLGVLVCALFLVGSGAARADIIVIGDTNVVSGLVSSGANEDAGNQQLFDNILGSGSSVVIDSDAAAVGARDLIQSYYGSQSGVTATLLASSLSGTNLSGVDLFVSVWPTSNYSTGELAALSAFQAAGGSVLFLGDYPLNSPYNGHLNAALSYMGSSMSLGTGFVGPAGWNTVGGSLIESHPLTSGVTSFTYAGSAGIAGGTALIHASGDSGVIVAVDNPVPEPSTFALLGLGAAGLALRRRKRSVA